jgi:hypothetical protein
MPTPVKGVEAVPTDRTSSEIIDRIVADNDPRNGTIGQRIIRALEEPDRRPDADGLYREESRPAAVEVLVEQQAADPNLWQILPSHTIGAVLQKQLRLLHEALEPDHTKEGDRNEQ